MRVVIYDIETLKEMFLLIAYIPNENKYYSFEVSDGKNQLDKMVRFIDKHNKYYWVGYNNLGFDAQVVEWIIRNYENWNEKSSLEIAAIIAQKANDVIDDRNYDILPEYTEDNLSFKQLDLFTIWHFNNKHRMISLKRLEFEIDFENIEEMPFSPNKENLTIEERNEITKYCINDVNATYEFYKITRGDTEHPLYKGKDKIADRDIMQKEFGLKCLNWDDVKIGAEWNKQDYIAITGKSEKELKPETINHFYGKKYKEFFPPTVEFQSPSLKKFVEDVGNTYIIRKKQDFIYRFNDELTISIGRGGIHSQEKPRMLIPQEDEKYIQCDFGSQYPNAIRKFQIFPQHLGVEWNKTITKKIERRLNFKKLAKETKDPKYESLQEMGKLSVNGGAYGRLNTQGDWQEDPCAMLQVTIGCQLEILMITEALILKGFNVVSTNTKHLVF